MISKDHLTQISLTLKNHVLFKYKQSFYLLNLQQNVSAILRLAYLLRKLLEPQF